MLRILNKIVRRVQWLRGYGEGFTEDGFRERERLRPVYNLIANKIMECLEFSSVYDIGCANGFLLTEFHRSAKQIGGIELSPDVRLVVSAELNKYIEVGDFSNAKGKWDLVTCIEVAETICRLATKSVVFSAATPGQEGHGHINCRPKSDWMGMFESRGWKESAPDTNRLQEATRDTTKAKWLVENIVVLKPM
jgi:hypothetical protein